MTHDVRPAQVQTNNPHIFFDNPAKETVQSRMELLRALTNNGIWHSIYLANMQVASSRVQR